MAANFSVAVNIGAHIGAGFESTVRHVERRFERMGRRLELAGARMKAIGAGGFGAIGMASAAGYAASRAMGPFVEFEDGLVRLGNVAEVGGARLDAIGKQIVKTGAKFGIGGRQALAGAQDFLAAGLNIDTALKALDPTLKLAKVAGIEDAEASQVGIAAMQNLNVLDAQLGAAYDILAKAGKLGRFEVDDLAKAMPGLASRAAALGMTGLDGVRRIASQAQIARESARDADEAANNLLNFYDKLSSGETQRKFAKMGVSIESVWERSQATGTDFVDNMLDEIGRLTKDGTDAFALSALFEDRQARQGAAALVRQRAKLRRTYAGTGQAAGTLDADFANLSRTTKFGLDRFAAGLERVGISLGKIFGPALGDAAMRMATLMERFADWAEKHPAVIRSIGTLVAGFVGLKAAVAGGAWILGSFVGSIGGLITRLSSLWRATLGARMALAMLGGLTRLGPLLLRGLARLGPLLLRGLARLGPLLLRGLALAFGLLSNPVGWAILAASALAIMWKYRKELKKFWDEKVVPWAKDAWKSIKEWWANIDWGATIQAIINKIAYWLGFAWVKVTEWWKNAWKALIDYVLSIDWGAVGKGVGLAIANGLTFGLAGKLSGLSVGNILKGALPSGASAAKFIGSTATGVGSSFSQGMKAAQGRALGGSVSAGVAYQWHERGREFFVPGRSGTVIDAATVAAINRGARSGGTTITNHFEINGATDPQETVRIIDHYMRRQAAGQSALLSD